MTNYYWRYKMHSYRLFYQLNDSSYLSVLKNAQSGIVFLSVTDITIIFISVVIIEGLCKIQSDFI
jgi:hypothetical protein